MTEVSEKVKRFAATLLGITEDAVRISAVTGDASARSYFRASARDTDSHSDSLIIAIYKETFDETQRAASRLEALERKSPSARLTFANDPCAHIEVTALFQEAGLPAPGILGALGSEGALLFEDVGDTRLQDWLTNQSLTTVTDAYERAAGFIVTIQEATHRAISSESICSKLAFDQAKLEWELGFFFDNYFDRYLNARPPEAEASRLKEEFRSLCFDLSSRPRVLVHRDYHTRNLMMHRDRMCIIDHQDARMGPASYDLASLLEDPYSRLDRPLVREMIERFIELKSRSAVPFDNPSDFMREYNLMTVQRMLKAVGTYSYQAAVMKNEVYVPYVEPAIKSALSALAALQEYPHIRRAIERTA